MGEKTGIKGKGASLGETQNIVQCKHIGIYEGNPSMSLTDKRTKQENKWRHSWTSFREQHVRNLVRNLIYIGKKWGCFPSVCEVIYSGLI